MRILTAAQMHRIDRRTEQQYGISSETLMDNAGREIATQLLRLYPGIREAAPLIVCGKGNNGGDGVTAARHLRLQGVRARVVLLARKASVKGAAASHLEKALAASVEVEEVVDPPAWAKLSGELGRRALIVDALLGTGLRGPARDLTARVIRDINGAGAAVVSVDIPSGLSGDSVEIVGPCVAADHTLALACPKLPHVLGPAAPLCGRLHVLDIGIPPAAIEEEGVTLNLSTEMEMAALVGPRPAESHKGDFGRVLIVGGSRGMSGAPALVCAAALRSGAGSVRAATAASAQPILAAHLMEMMTEPLPETSAGSIALAAGPVLRELLGRSDVVALGPGLSSEQETMQLVHEVTCTTALPVVLDADGLNAFAGRVEELSGAGRAVILTPHPGEMARLLGDGGRRVTTAEVQADRVDIARGFARDHACHVILKGYHSVIATPEGEAWINPTGNPGMATAGSGDVLTGILAALLGQGLSPLSSCLLGAYVHGLAGDLAAGKACQRSLLAGDIIDFLPDSFRHLEQARAALPRS